MTRRLCVLLGFGLALVVLVVPAGAVSTAGCTDSWTGSTSGVWGLAANWTNGIPTPTDSVCITAPGTYTVTLQPWTFGTADPNFDGSTVASLTLGSTGAGTQTLSILGQGSTSNSNEQNSTTFLSVTGASTIATHGALVLDSTDGGSLLPGNPKGGYAAFLGGSTLTNAGKIETEVQDASNKAANTTQIAPSLTNESTGSVQDMSGTLEVDGVTNDGSFTVAKGGSLALASMQGFGTGASFTNNGKLANSGAISGNQSGGSFTWSQLGGSITGNPVTLSGNIKLVDKAGPAKFLVNLVGAALTGTVAHGQTITVVGAAYNSSGNEYYGTALSLGGGVVTNDGTIILDAVTQTSTAGGPATINNGTLRNNGTVIASDPTTTATAQLQVGLTNAHSGTVSVTKGSLVDTAGGTLINDGTIRVAPKSALVLNNGTSLTNKADATLGLDIQSATSLGQLQLNSGTFTAAGTLDPILHGHAAPNTDFHLFPLGGGTFNGTFAHTAANFTADYAHKTATPAYVGAIYKSSKKK